VSDFDWQRHAQMMRASKSRPLGFDAIPPGETGFRGVYFQHDKGKYRAHIEINGRRRHLGYFDFPTAAARAYDKEAFRAWGAAAFLNFPAAPKADGGEHVESSLPLTVKG
jgi:hypothetical protein